jgi:hypothetical protein
MAGVYIAASLAWLKWVDGQSPDRWDFLGALVCLTGAAIILFPVPQNHNRKLKDRTNMKTNLRILTLAAALCVGLFTATAADKHDKHKATPKGGRLLDKTEPHAEFVVEKDRTVTINFYNEEMKPVAATTQP